jgi:hypothetical protein
MSNSRLRRLMERREELSQLFPLLALCGVEEELGG